MRYLLNVPQAERPVSRRFTRFAVSLAGRARAEKLRRLVGSQPFIHPVLRILGFKIHCFELLQLNPAQLALPFAQKVFKLYVLKRFGRYLHKSTIEFIIHLTNFIMVFWYPVGVCSSWVWMIYTILNNRIYSQGIKDRKSGLANQGLKRIEGIDPSQSGGIDDRSQSSIGVSPPLRSESTGNLTMDHR